MVLKSWAVPMEEKFVNRREELKILEEEYAREKASFIVIYGRRRVGKTRLIEEFVKNKKKYFYYLAADEKEHLQIKEFRESIANFLNDEVLLNLNVTDWKTLLSYIEKVWPKNEKIILAIDEYFFAECKWRPRVNAEKVCGELALCCVCQELF